MDCVLLMALWLPKSSFPKPNPLHPLNLNSHNVGAFIFSIGLGMYIIL